MTLCYYLVTVQGGNLGFGADSNGKVQGFTLCFYGNNGQCGLPIEPPMAEINWA